MFTFYISLLFWYLSLDLLPVKANEEPEKVLKHLMAAAKLKRNNAQRLSQQAVVLSHELNIPLSTQKPTKPPKINIKPKEKKKEKEFQKKEEEEYQTKEEESNEDEYDDEEEEEEKIINKSVEKVDVPEKTKIETEKNNTINVPNSDNVSPFEMQYVSTNKDENGNPKKKMKINLPQFQSPYDFMKKRKAVENFDSKTQILNEKEKHLVTDISPYSITYRNILGKKIKRQRKKRGINSPYIGLGKNWGNELQYGSDSIPGEAPGIPSEIIFPFRGRYIE
ncbi:hypothetical protein SNEBB_008779 [Seison nebaliae]|nr:hypothetical protein SNEBB_008779 [Seison nebaliae]